MNHNSVVKFRKLHQTSSCLVLANAWDCASAALVQSAGAKAIATSSASLAWANGYPDGNALSSSLLLNSVEKLVRVCEQPLSIDIEAGYSNEPEQVAALVVELAELGVAGINIEDGQDSPDLFEAKLSAIRERLGLDGIFINARTDVYLQSLVPDEQKPGEVEHRLTRYANSGADSAFVPGLLNVQDIRQLVSAISLPLNIMLPSLDVNREDFIEAGVKRLSYGPGTFLEAYKQLLLFSDKAVDKTELTYDKLNDLMNRL